jgi:predicted acyl esterase
LQEDAVPAFRISVAAAATAAAAAAVGALAVAAAPAADAAAPGYSVQTLHFAVTIGPDNAQHCDVVGDLYTPAAANPQRPVPAVLTTNGFGGSKDDQAGIAKALAVRGYEVLSYSGLGFGGSGCKITLDDPSYDGKAASQLVSYLGGAPGIAYTDAAHTAPAPRLQVVEHDAVDHTGQARRYDPRVGMIGGSYGGEIQFAAADVDPRVDTIVPLITWNDLAYSIDPNNATQVRGVTTAVPGTTKLVWGVAFSAEGVVDGVQGAPNDPSRMAPCPNFADFVCPALVTAGSTGYFQPDTVAAFRHASVTSYMKRIRIPVLLIQGEKDTLFNLNEAIATYQALRAQGTPVKMIWQSWGHSDSAPAPGEIDLNNPDPSTQYETARVLNWFAHYLKDASVGTGPQFSYFREWISYHGNAAPAYATSSSFPVGSPDVFRLSGSGDLVNAASAVQPGSQSFATPPAGAPSSINPVDVLSGYAQQFGSGLGDAPGTYASWTSAPLANRVDVAGEPVFTAQLQAPTLAASSNAGPGGDLVLFVKLEDVAPDGSATMIHGLEAPIRVADVSKPIKITLPAIVHRFAPAHQIRLVVAGGSENYRGGLVPTPVTIASGAAQRLALPVVG